MPHAHRSKLKMWIIKALRGIARAYFRPGWVEHGKHGATLPSGVYIANYASWADVPLLALILEKEFAEQEKDFAVAINIRHKNRWWAKLTAKLVTVFHYDPTRSDAECNALLADAIAQGRSVLLQPEGRATDTGALLPVCDTLASMLADIEPLLHPIYVEGTERSVFGNSKPRQHYTAWWPRTTLHLFPAMRLALPAGSKGRERTAQAARQIYDVLSQAAFEHYDYHCTLFRGVLRAMHRHGGRHIIAEDVERNRLSYRKLVAGAYVLGAALEKRLHENEATVGLMLPNVNGGLVAFCALQAYGRIPAMLNFTAGRRNICSAAKTASIRTIITSKRFIKVAELEQTMNALREEGFAVIYLEDLRKELGIVSKLKGLGRAWLGFRGYDRLHRDTNMAFDSERPAVILFTSGSEGTPKGVALTHENLMANMGQLQARMDVGIADCIFNPLPMFHTSGLTGGLILPLMTGMKMFLYPSPLHYQTIPELIADTQSTVLFATDTFLTGYARYATPYHLHRLRYVFAGAEKLRDETRRVWAEQFGVRVFEGYGVTETAPVLAVNTPMFCKPGSVGRLMPSVEHRIEPVEGIEEGGRLIVKAPNVMAGYILADKPDSLTPPEDGWHDTGDIVRIDDEGFVHIIGRAKRFAKIGGEMVSLAAIEQHVAELWPEEDHAVVTRPDTRKGEQVVLVTTREDAPRQDILAHFREIGLPELYVPRDIMTVENIPVLGSGKVDYPAVLELANSSAKDEAKSA